MATQILMPALSPTMEEGTLAKWLVKEGDSVASGDLLAEIETDKATMEFEAVDDGIIGKILVVAGTDAVKVNTPIAILLEEGESLSDLPQPASDNPAKPSAPSPSAAPAALAAPPQKTGQRLFATPLARRIALERGLDLNTIKGSGPHGRIVKADVENAEASSAIAPPETATSALSPAAGPVTAHNVSAPEVTKSYADRTYTEVPLDGMRKTIAARLSEAKQTIPHFYLRRSVNIDELLAFRAELNRELADQGQKLSVNDLIIKACARALQLNPDANAVWAGDRVLRFTRSDVAVAVAVEGGLFTPVLKDADQKSLSALSQEMKDLASRARDKKLSPDEYQGGSFAISNLGMFGIENFDAVINPPHGAILAVGAGMKKPVVAQDGALAVATMMSLTLSVDHRVIDGALGATLLSDIVDGLERPMRLVV